MEELNNCNQVDKSLSFVVLGNKSDLAQESKDCPCELIIKRWCEKQNQDFGSGMAKPHHGHTWRRVGMGMCQRRPWGPHAPPLLRDNHICGGSEERAQIRPCHAHAHTNLARASAKHIFAYLRDLGSWALARKEN